MTSYNYDTSQANGGSEHSGEFEGALKDRVSEAKQKAHEAKEHLVGQASQRARSAFADQRNRAAGQLEGLAHALRDTGQRLHDHDQQAVARYADWAAERADKLSDYVRERDVDDVLREVEGFARRRPDLFIGGAFLLGFFMARFLKSSEESGGERWPHSGRRTEVTGRSETYEPLPQEAH